MQIYKGNGKLLLTGEYVVLDGAKALALPCKLGQELIVNELKEELPKIYWKALKHDASLWFSCCITINSWKIIESTSKDMAERLVQVFKALNTLNPNTFKVKKSYTFTSKLDFKKNWGLGSSSTLIYNLAQWSNINPYHLLEKTFGGSGFDIACASSKKPILYQRTKEVIINQANFKPSFLDDLGFVYLNKKQNSRDGIKAYKERKKDIGLINSISNITESIIHSTNIIEFEELLDEHEILIAKYLNIKPIKQTHFKDYNGSIKSLGAWGGDFVLATQFKSQKEYFKNKGYFTYFDFNNLVYH